MAEIHWERRREGEPTNEYLGRVLESEGLHDLADRAALYHYDDYFCPKEIDDGLNIHRLVADLATRAQRVDPIRAARLLAIAEAAKGGEFDGTREESRRWAASPDGRATFAELHEAVRRDAPTG